MVRTPRLIWSVMTSAALAAGAFAATVAPGAAASAATVHPGVQTFTNGGQCTANFIFSDGTSSYIGQAAHCSSTGSSTQTDGCTTQSLPLGTPVVILGASKPGTLAYNSWIAMQQVHETDPNACAYNDLALVRIDPADVDKIDSSVPHWGGPVGLNTSGAPAGSAVYSYGNSILRGGVTLLSPKVGTSGGDIGAGWSHMVTTVTPGIPGDSGSGFLDANGNALGDLSTVAVSVPGGVNNNVSDLSHELQYLNSHPTGLAPVQLVNGRVAFNASAIPLDTANPVDNPVGGLSNFLGV